jgi:hypothetical protein
MMDEPTLLVLTPDGPRRGRPPLSRDEPSTDVCVKMPEGMYDAAYQVASRERISVPEVIRRALGRLLTESK